MHSSQVGLCVSITFWHAGDTAQTCPAVNILNATHKGTANSTDCHFYSKADTGQLNLPHRTIFFLKYSINQKQKTYTCLMALCQGLSWWASIRKVKTSLDFTEARDSEWQWHQLGHMQVGVSIQTDNYDSTTPLSFFAGRMPFLPPNQQRQSTEGKKTRTENCSKKTGFHCPILVCEMESCL